MRLSSPTFDDQVGDLSQADINAFDSLNAQLSQASSVPNRTRRSSYLGPSKARYKPSTSLREPPQDLSMDEENPFCTTRGGQMSDTLYASGKEHIYASFMTASAVNEHAGASSAGEDLEDSNLPDDAPPEVDHSAWFNSDSANTFVGFKTAATSLRDTLPAFQRPSVGGEKPKEYLLPSAAALREAEEKMRKWQDDEHLSSPQPTPADSAPSVVNLPLLSPPPAFSTVSRVFSPTLVPETPTPAPHIRSANVDPPATSIRSSFQSLSGRKYPKPFKSPMVIAAPHHAPIKPITTATASSPPRMHQLFTSASSQVSSTPAPLSPLRPSSVANQVMSQKPLGFTPRHGSTTRPKFVTPFKVVQPGDPRSSTLRITKHTPTPLRQGVVANRSYPPSVSHSPCPSKVKDIWGRRIFDIAPPPGRQTLATSGLRPRVYGAEELEDMGMFASVFPLGDPRTAHFYAFNNRSRAPPEPSDSSPPLILGHAAALEELHRKGCSLATKAWVENHWPLVLWKLAGMVALDPTSENDPALKRWCWPEVIRQLMYRSAIASPDNSSCEIKLYIRYERDLNGSSRPPLRLITTRDASAESPMVLCVSNITWSSSGCDENGIPLPPHPKLEVTDGWYRLRARIDAPLARAVKKGKIKIGRKIAVAGAKLSSERKEGSEILEAYDSSVLLLTGNSSHMAAWHAKLGFQRRPFFATLNSLSADGGNVAVMMLEVIKAYPVGYIEFIEDADGRKRREGPREAKEESKLSMQWKAKRDLHASKLWSDAEKRRSMMLDYAERLEQRAGPKFNSEHEDGPPDKIYDMYDTMQEDPAAAKGIISSISCKDANWLARHIRDKTVQEQEGVSREIEQGLESICPPREVKAFCVVLVKDARTQKYPSKRKAQVTVWDVPGMSVTEGSTEGPFASGQQFIVSKLFIANQRRNIMVSSGHKLSAYTVIRVDGLLRWFRGVFEHEEEF
ncbi:hypothetical protein BU15DRAFT_70904 [Melanogaster broomeanus]|nr:hypothetical protein BU15DRAFT_70904 [Melanogaster broomeanus]